MWQIEGTFYIPKDISSKLIFYQNSGGFGASVTIFKGSFLKYGIQRDGLYHEDGELQLGMLKL